MTSNKIYKNIRKIRKSSCKKRSYKRKKRSYKRKKRSYKRKRFDSGLTGSKVAPDKEVLPVFELPIETITRRREALHSFEDKFPHNKKKSLEEIKKENKKLSILTRRLANQLSILKSIEAKKEEKEERERIEKNKERKILLKKEMEEESDIREKELENIVLNYSLKRRNTGKKI